MAEDDVAAGAVAGVQHLQRVVAVNAHVGDGDDGERAGRGEAALFEQLAARALLDSLSGIDAAAGEVPAARHGAACALEDEDLAVALRKDGAREGEEGKLWIRVGHSGIIRDACGRRNEFERSRGGR